MYKMEGPDVNLTHLGFAISVKYKENELRDFFARFQLNDLLCSATDSRRHATLATWLASPPPPPMT